MLCLLTYRNNKKPCKVLHALKKSGRGDLSARSILVNFSPKKKNLPSNGSNTKFSTTFFEAAGGVLNKYKITALCVLRYSTHKALRIFLEYEGGDLNKYKI